MSKVTQQQFETLSALLLKELGMKLTREKDYLLESRLLPIANTHGLDGFDGLIAKINTPAGSDIRKQVIEAMTTNESLFFRDKQPFDDLKDKVLPMFKEQAKERKAIRIWSAACSTGQEPYSLAMMLMEEKFLTDGWKAEIVATDISEEVLEKARKGKYSQFEVQRGLQIRMLLQYFEQRENNQWEAKEELRKMVNFKKMNLLEDFSRMGMFDLILCRNVLIYFEEELKLDIIRRLSKQLHPGGLLMLGGAETIISSDMPQLKLIKDLRGMYQHAA